jgi:tetratricopeptide (TPR) repeat protein
MSHLRTFRPIACGVARRTTARRSAILVAFVTSLCFPVQLFGQGVGEARGVSGMVRDAKSHDPVVGARVDLVAESGLAAPTAYSNENGEFHFFARDGDYQIMVTKIGYEKSQVSVSIVGGHSTELNIDLRPAASDSGASGPEKDLPGTISAHELSAPSNARDDYAKGKDLMTRKDYDGAIESFQKATREFPDFYEAYARMGVAQYMAGHANDARTSLQKSIDLSNSKYSDALFDLADVYNDIGNYSGAEPLARQVIALNESSWHGYFELSRALLGLKRYPDAEQSAQKCIGLVPQNRQIYIILTNIHIGMHDYPKAVSDIDAYLQLDPNGPTSEAMRSTRSQLARAIADSKKNRGPSKSSEKPQ